MIITVELTFPTDALPRGDALLKGLARVAAETGHCLRYEIHADRDQAGRFLLYEAWTSPEAFEAYQASPGFGTLAEGVVALVTEPVRIRRYGAPVNALV